MPEKDWYSLTIRKEAALKVSVRAKNKNLTVGEFINTLWKPTLKGVWSMCTLCGVRVKVGNVVNHMSRVHPKTIRRCDLTG